jgi:dihydrofolate synthase/folylpolyglutamate synthase
MTFAETIRFLYSLGHELKAVKWDLDRIRTVLAALGDPQSRSRFIHVAGTNGKGSTCALMESSLRASGVRTGLYTSPHLVNPRERIQIDGRWISEQVWIDAFERVHRASEALLARDRIDAHPSFFETLTAMAFVAFAEEPLDVVVLETGLGGRLDATNVVAPELCVITPIDFDHEALLGSSIESIAAEKAGILKPGCPAVFAEQRPEAFGILESRALELDCPVTLSSAWRVTDLALEKFGSRFLLSGAEEIPIDCPLAGAHQVENVRTAVAALDCAGLTPPPIRAGIASARWPGRLERVAASPDVILDGAHNPAGARALAAYIRQFFPREPVRLIFGAMRDKAMDEVIGTLFPLAQEVIATAPDQPRSLSPESIRESADHPNLRTAPQLKDALKMAEAKPMTTFITGSLYLVGEALAAFSIGLAGRGADS